MRQSTIRGQKNPGARNAVILLLLLRFGLTLSYASQPSSGISFAQISFTNPAQPYSQYGRVTVSKVALYGDGYINVERYESGKGVGWVVRNLPVRTDSAQSELSATFDLGGSGRQYSFTAYVDFSAAPLPDDETLKGQTPLVYVLEQTTSAADNPNQFEDVVCHKDDAKFWAGQQSVVAVQVKLARLSYADSSGWIIKGKDPTKILMISASHNFTDQQINDTTATVNYQKTTCGGKTTEDFFPVDVDQVLERNKDYDFVIVSLKKPEEGRTLPPPLQALYKDIKLGDLVSLPQHPAEVIPFKEAGYYYDIANKKRCQITTTAAINSNLGEIDAKCGAVHGTSGSPLLDATETKDNTPYAIGLIVGCRQQNGRECKPLAAAGYKMSAICDFDAGKNGKQLLDCKKPGE